MNSIMGRYDSVAVIYGSDSSESEVSCRSGEYVASRIDGSRYDVYEIYARHGGWTLVALRRRNSMRVTFAEGARPEVDKSDFSVSVYGEKVKFDYAYVVQHGAPGETGQMQGYLEMLGVPYSSCSSFVSAISFDKYGCKAYLRSSGIVGLAPDMLVRRGVESSSLPGMAASAGLKYPLFVKPTTAGSSFGISRVDNAEALAGAVGFAFSESPTVLVEQALSGRELTCAVWAGESGVKALPVIEIVTDNDYFDYDAKYNGHSEEVCPAVLSDAERSLVEETSVRIYGHLGCKGVVRMDYILAEDGLYFLEVNTIPGMTSASLVPKMVRAAGLRMTDFLNDIIEHS